MEQFLRKCQNSPHFINTEVRNRSPLIPILSQKKPLHTVPFSVFKVYFNTVLSFGHMSSKRFPSFRFTHQNTAIISLSLPCLLLLRPSHPALFDDPNNYTTLTFTFFTIEFSFTVLHLCCLQLHMMGTLWIYYAD